MATKDVAGIQYPFVQYGQGLPFGVKGPDVYASALFCLLRTNQRSRVMRPTLGTRIQKLIFDTNGPLLKNLITKEILETVGSELPEVLIVGLNIEDSDHSVDVSINYLIQGVEGSGVVSFSKE